MIVHLGIAIIAAGIVGSGLFRAEKTITMAPGDVVEVGGERLRFDGVRELPGPNYMAIQARVTLERSGRAVYPERRSYLKQEQPMSESGIDSTPLRDVYVVLAEQAGAGRWGMQVYVNPLVQFIWGGGFVILLGLWLGLSRRHKATGRVATEAA
jgi:cytochrome c-type biogenesis protein CcmF